MSFPKKLVTLLIAAAFSADLHAAQVTTVIDPFTTPQQLFTNNATVTNTIAATSIGNYRTLVLGTPGASVVPTFFYVDDSTQTLSLDTPLGITPSFQIIWGGEGGTNGLGGVALGGGQPLDLMTSLLSFALVATDQSSNFSWSFTDMATNTATYTGNFPAHSSTDPVLPFNIALDSFNNASGIDWNAIDFIVLSGGGTASLDMTLAAPIQLVASTVPEPGTWALLATGLGLTALVLRRKARRCP